ncbi:hypothetical protein ACYOEI_26930 [Singulisphaera rosea]
MTEAEIEDMIAGFEDGSLPRSEWTHGNHLVMALWYLRSLDPAEAGAKIRDGIRRYNGRQGNPGGYHETITRAWIVVIERFLGTKDRAVSVAALAEELLQECGDTEYLLRFYSRERLFSPEARLVWVPPDLRGIGESPHFAARSDGRLEGEASGLQ